jgi:hypothetical protein
MSKLFVRVRALGIAFQGGTQSFSKDGFCRYLTTYVTVTSLIDSTILASTITTSRIYNNNQKQRIHAIINIATELTEQNATALPATTTTSTHLFRPASSSLQQVKANSLCVAPLVWLIRCYFYIIAIE